MHSKKMGLLAVLFVAVLVTPVLSQAFADVYYPPGPPSSMSEWITPTLGVYNMNNSMSNVGWVYSTGPMYNYTSGKTYDPIKASSPDVVGSTDIGFGTGVMILGFIPGITVSMEEACPSVELTITWNGVPNTVTLTQSIPVGANVPPTIQKDITGVYQPAYPGNEPGVVNNKHAQWNVYYGPWSSVLKTEFGIAKPAAWTYKYYGLFFWYKFIPNVGDYISYNCDGKVMDPPTYDVTALVEGPTTQIWFNHVCWNVDFLQIHKTVSYIGGQYYPTSGNNGEQALDNLVIQNVGLVPATGLQVIETFPVTSKYGVEPYSVAGTVQAMLTGTGQNTGFEQAITYFNYSVTGLWTTMKAPFNTLSPGENLTINQQLTVFEEISGTGTAYNVNIIFDSMCAANEIPAWKDPIGLFALPIGSPSGSPTELFDGMELLLTGGSVSASTFPVLNVAAAPTIGGGSAATFGIVSEWPVAGPWLRFQLFEASMTYVLDPVPVSLSGGSAVTSADVNLVRQEICGLAPYDPRMDLTAKGFVSLQDLAAYKAASGQ